MKACCKSISYHWVGVERLIEVLAHDPHWLPLICFVVIHGTLRNRVRAVHPRLHLKSIEALLGSTFDALDTSTWQKQLPVL